MGLASLLAKGLGKATKRGATRTVKDRDASYMLEEGGKAKYMMNRNPAMLENKLRDLEREYENLDKKRLAAKKSGKLTDAEHLQMLNKGDSLSREIKEVKSRIDRLGKPSDMTKTNKPDKAMATKTDEPKKREIKETPKLKQDYKKEVY